MFTGHVRAYHSHNSINLTYCYSGFHRCRNEWDIFIYDAIVEIYEGDAYFGIG